MIKPKVNQTLWSSPLNSTTTLFSKPKKSAQQSFIHPKAKFRGWTQHKTRHVVTTSRISRNCYTNRVRHMNRQFNWRQRRHNDWLWLRSPLWIQEAKKKHLDHTQKARLIRFHSSKIRCVNHRPCFGGASAIMWARGVNERASVRCFFFLPLAFRLKCGVDLSGLLGCTSVLRTIRD